MSDSRGTRGRRLALQAGAIALLCAALGGAAQAQCTGDCNNNGAVTINELITGVNIALGSAQLSACPSYDRNGSSAVEINELIAAVNAALNGCTPIGPTATPTATSSVVANTATVTATPTTAGPTSTVTMTPTQSNSTCGNSQVENPPETCDDGNTENGDSCPSDCRIEPCASGGSPVVADILFTTDSPELAIGGLTVFVQYPDGVVDVPGSGFGDPATAGAVASDVFSLTPNDLDYGLNLVMLDPFQIGYPAGTLAATITFTTCGGGGVPPGDAFTCTVSDAITPDAVTVTDQVACQFELR